MIHPLIIGSGPAGVSAAQTIVDNAKLIEHLTGQVVKPVMLSEAAFPGGQGLRRLNPQMGFEPRKLYRNEEAKYRNFHGNADALIGQIDYRPRTTVWSLYEGTAFVESAGELMSYLIRTSLLRLVQLTRSCRLRVGPCREFIRSVGRRLP